VVVEQDDVFGEATTTAVEEPAAAPAPMGDERFAPPVVDEAERTAGPAVPTGETAGTTASVPMMITRQMEADLLARGITQQEINRLTPQQAQDILAGAGTRTAGPAVPTGEDLFGEVEQRGETIVTPAPVAEEAAVAAELAQADADLVQATAAANERVATLDRPFLNTLAEKYGRPAMPVTPASEPFETLSVARDTLEIAAASASDPQEIAQIFAASRGLPEQSRIDWAIANNPYSSEETFTAAQSSPELAAMTTDEAIASLTERRAQLKAQSATPAQGSDAFIEQAQREYDVLFNQTLQKARAGDVEAQVAVSMMRGQRYYNRAEWSVRRGN
jgi:hypothetical protein